MMDARTQTEDAAAFEATRRHYYRPVSDGSGNVKRLEKIEWATALVMIPRGDTKGWILARDAKESDPRQLSLVPDEPEAA